MNPNLPKSETLQDSTINKGEPENYKTFSTSPPNSPPQSNVLEDCSHGSRVDVTKNYISLIRSARDCSDENSPFVVGKRRRPMNKSAVLQPYVDRKKERE